LAQLPKELLSYVFCLGALGFVLARNGLGA